MGKDMVLVNVFARKKGRDGGKKLKKEERNTSLNSPQRSNYSINRMSWSSLQKPITTESETPVFKGFWNTSLRPCDHRDQQRHLLPNSMEQAPS
jgi:hypothetical protein